MQKMEKAEASNDDSTSKEDHEFEGRTNKWILIAVVFIFYISIQTILYGYKKIFQPPVSSYNVYEDIFTDIDGLRKEIRDVRSLAASGTSITDAVLINQMSKLEERYNNISDTLMESPEEAITAKVLKLEQKSADIRISFLQEEVVALRNRIDDFIFGVVSTAVLGVIFAAAVSFIAVAVKYVLWGKWGKKKN